jgi:1-pyrroline-5-carboxylate dehydrogenase
MSTEFFGPIVTVFAYEDDKWDKALELVDTTSPYALTGAVFATDEEAIETADRRLRFSAGNFYVNDKPTGSVVGHQPFGGSRGSGTNDKAGWETNVQRWISPRIVKRNLAPPTDHRYPSMDPDT